MTFQVMFGIVVKRVLDAMGVSCAGPATLQTNLRA